MIYTPNIPGMDSFTRLYLVYFCFLLIFTFVYTWYLYKVIRDLSKILALIKDLY